MLPIVPRKALDKISVKVTGISLAFMMGLACKPIVMNQEPGAPEAGKVKIQVAESLLNAPAPALRLSLIAVSKADEDPEELDHLSSYDMEPGPYCFTIEAEHLKEKTEVQALQYCFTAEADELYQLDGVAENGGTILVYATNAPDYSKDRRTVASLQLQAEKSQGEESNPASADEKQSGSDESSTP